MFNLLASEAPNSFLLPGDINEFYWGTVAFVVVFGLLGKFAVPVLRKGLQARSEKIAKELGAADAAKAEALAEAERIRASIGNAEADAAAVVAEARTAAAQLVATMKERSVQEAADLRTRAAADIESQKNQAIADLRAEVTELARGAAEAVVRSNLDDATQAALIDRYIDQVGA